MQLRVRPRRTRYMPAKYYMIFHILLTDNIICIYCSMLLLKGEEKIDAIARWRYLILQALSRYLCRLAAIACLSRPPLALRLKYLSCCC